MTGDVEGLAADFVPVGILCKCNMCLSAIIDVYSMQDGVGINGQAELLTGLLDLGSALEPTTPVTTAEPIHIGDSVVLAPRSPDEERSDAFLVAFIC